MQVCQIQPNQIFCTLDYIYSAKATLYNHDNWQLYNTGLDVPIIANVARRPHPVIW